MSRISGAITVSVEIVEQDGSRRNVVFEVPETDMEFHWAVTQRWIKSFPELAWLAAQSDSTGENA